MRQAMSGTALRAVPHGRSSLFRGAGRSNLVGATIPAPVKGWDANSPLADMDPAAAIILDNWFPEPAYVRLRAGHASHATGLGSGPVESVMAWNGPSSQKLFGARGTSVFNVTSAGAVGAADLTSMGNAQFQHINFTTAGGSYLYIVNGSAAPRHYDGSSWATPSISGITTTDAIHINAHKNRVWFVLKNSTKAAYLPTSSIAGAASTFDLGVQMTKGGYLVAMATITQDGGIGGDDQAVFITSRGQVIVYAGDDPASSDSWVLRGVYEIGAPIGRRCFCKIGGDLGVITVDGVIPVSSLALDRTVLRKAAITANIQRAMNAAAILGKGVFGWQFITYPLGTAAILNVPITDGSVYHQYVLNPLTGAWCRYTGINAVCWEMLADTPYVGGLNGVVYKADTGNLDAGRTIVADLKTAFNYFGSRGINKSYRMVRALMAGDGRVVPTMSINTDYRDSPQPDIVASIATQSGALWNSFNWNDGTLWGGGAINMDDWIGVENEGHCAAIRMKVAPLNQNSALALDLRLNSFDILMQKGAYL